MMSQRISDAQAEEFVAAASLVIRRVRVKTPASLRELTWTQRAVLSRLETDGPATSAELARAQGVSSQSMSAAVNFLQELGLVRRDVDPADARQLIVTITEKGTALRQHARIVKKTWLARALDRLDDEDLLVLLKASEIMKRMAEEP